MASRAKAILANHRERMSREGFVRVEVRVHEEDAELLRHLASALRDPGRRDEARLSLRERFGGPPKPSFKAFLASAPLEDIDLERGRDLGRDVDL